MWIWVWVQIKIKLGVIWFVGWVRNLVWTNKPFGKPIPTGCIKVDPGSCPGVSEDLNSRDKGSFWIGVIENCGWPVPAGQTIVGGATIEWPKGESLPSNAGLPTGLSLTFATQNPIAGHQPDSAVAAFGGNQNDELAFRVANDATKVVLSVGGLTWTGTHAASGGLAWRRSDGTPC